VKRNPLVLGAAGIAAAIVLVWVVVTFLMSSAPKGGIAGVPPAGSGPSSSGLADLKAKEFAEKEKLTLAKVKQQRAVDTGTRALQLLKTASDEKTRWDKEITPLLTNSTGKKLTAEDRLVETFVNVYERPKPDAGEIDAAKGRVTALIEAPKTALADPESVYAPGDEFLGQIEKERKWAEDAIRAYQSPREQIQALLVSADANPESGEVLEKVIANYKARAALNAAEAERDQNERNQAKIETAKRDQADELAQQQVAKIQQETQTRLVEEQAEAEDKRLEELAKNPGIQAKFAPFLEKGRYMGGESLPGSVAPTPWAYKYLSGFQVLTSYERFIEAATSPRDHIRPRWRKPTTKEENEEYHQRFELFGKLAPIWRDMGLIAP
jgi:hypothetical protein